MHEMSIAVEIVRQVEQVARQHQATRVDEVEIEIGVLQQVVPEALRIAYESAIEGTIAEGSTLVMTEEKMVARCGHCNEQFEPELDDFTCPHCRQAEAQVMAGNSITLKSIACETPEEQTGP